MAAGERFRPVFPLAGTGCVHVCFPEFRSDRCIHEEEEEVSTISDKLKSLHNGVYVDTIEAPVQSSDTNDPKEFFFTWLNMNCTNVLLHQVKRISPLHLRLTVCSHMP